MGILIKKVLNTGKIKIYKLKCLACTVLLFFVFSLISFEYNNENNDIDTLKIKSQVENINEGTRNKELPNPIERRSKDTTCICSDTFYILIVNKNIQKINIQRWAKIT